MKDHLSLVLQQNRPLFPPLVSDEFHFLEIMFKIKKGVTVFLVSREQFSKKGVKVLPQATHVLLKQETIHADAHFILK
jgi:hypothetical protein